MDDDQQGEVAIGKGDPFSRTKGQATSSAMRPAQRMAIGMAARTRQLQRSSQIGRFSATCFFIGNGEDGRDVAADRHEGDMPEEEKTPELPTKT